MLAVNFIFSDGCPSNITEIPSPSGNPNLTLKIVWPETNIGVLAVADCPCGSNGSSGLQATHYCGGDFNNGASWMKLDVIKCNFSDLARKICRLSEVSLANDVIQYHLLLMCCSCQ